MQKDMNAIFDKTQDELDKETESSKQVAQESMKQLMALKKERAGTVPSTEKPSTQENSDDETSPWKIEYEDY